MTPQELHLSILERAFQGRLTERIHSDETGTELLEAIKSEKLRLIKAKVIKKEKELPAITEDDIPFDIPESWAWAYVGDVFLHNTGKAQNSSGSANGIVRKFITTSNLYWNRFDFSKVKEMPFTEKELERCTVRKGDLLVCEGGDCGRSAIWYYDEEVCIQNHVHRLRPYVEISIEYFYHLFYLYKFTGKLRGRGVGIQGLSNEAIHQVICPLPPLAEQKRIVAKIEELLPLIDRYEQAWSALEAFNKRFPVDMQKSILQMAIKGKLVDQKATDGSVLDALDLINLKREELIRAGKLKKLGKINKTSEVDIEIPDTWRFVRLSEIICKRVDNRGKTPPHSLIKTKEHCIDLLEINAIVPGGSINHDNVEKYISEETYTTLRGYVEADDILIATVGSVGKFAMMDDSRSAIAQNIIAIKCFEEVDQKYIFYLLQTPYFYASMGNITMEAVQASIKVPDLMNLRVPLPPLAEQKRIVAKLEEILPLCERLK